VGGLGEGHQVNGQTTDLHGKDRLLTSMGPEIDADCQFQLGHLGQERFRWV
jgi:hypothetical protein